MAAESEVEPGKLSTVMDRFGNTIYLTHERWAHIVDPDNHPEVEPFFAAVAETIRFGHRRMKLDYDEDADVLYVAFDRSEHVTGVQIADNILLRLDTGKATGVAPRAVGLTFISFRAMMAHHSDHPLSVSLANLRDLPRDVWLATVEVLTTPPVSDFLGIVLSLNPHSPPLPSAEPQRLSA